MARHPGHVTIEWLGYRAEPPIGLLVLAMLLSCGQLALSPALIAASRLSRGLS
jgi:hypothetical protein